MRTENFLVVKWFPLNIPLQIRGQLAKFTIIVYNDEDQDEILYKRIVSKSSEKETPQVRISEPKKKLLRRTSMDEQKNVFFRARTHPCDSIQVRRVGHNNDIKPGSHV